MADRQRLLLVASVFAALVAGGATLAVLPSNPAEPAPVAVPAFAPAATSVRPLTAGRPVTGAQIVEIAAGPVTERARALAAQAVPSASPTTEPATPTARPGARVSKAELDELSSKVRKACRSGELRGRVCDGG